MSETLIETASAYQAEYRVYEPESHAAKANGASNEIKDPSWGDRLTEFVGANAQAIIECEWMGGAKVTLGEAMSFYPWPPNMTPDDIPFVMAVVLEHVTNRRVKEEPPEVEPEEEKPAKIETSDQGSEIETEAQKEPEKISKTETERQLEKAPEDANSLELPVSQSEVTVEPQGGYVLAAEAEQVAGPAGGGPEQSIQSSAKTEGPTIVSSKSATRVEAVDTSANSSVGKTNTNDLLKTVVLSAKSSTSLRSTTNSVTNESNQEIRPMAPPVKDQLNGTQPAVKTAVEAKQKISTFEMPEAVVTANPTVEAKPAPDKSELVVDEGTESTTLPEAVEAAIEPELTELSTLDFESEVILDETMEMIDEKIEVAEYEPPLVNLEPEMDTDSHTDILEEEILLDRLQEVDLGPNELDISSIPTSETATDIGETEEEQPALYINSEPNLSVALGDAEPEQLVKNTLAIEEIENSLIQLAEGLEANVSEPETTEQLNEILDKIIEVPAKLEDQNSENIVTEEEAQEELEELFVVLFNKLGVDYTPELIESLATLTLRWHLADEIEMLKNEKEIEAVPKASGPHVIIKRLLVSLSNIKKAMAHAYALGKSALVLYSFNFAT